MVIRELTISDPYDRVTRTRRARAILASQAPIVRITRHTNRLEKLVGERIIVIRRARVRVIASRHRRDIRICFR